MSMNTARRQLTAAGTAPSCLSSLQEAARRVAQAAVDGGDIPGVVAQVWRKGELLADVATGWFNVESRTPMNRSAIFGIASMTKPVTVALALRALDEGQLALTDPIARWLPQFANLRVLRSPAAALDDTVPAARGITVQDLMTHRSGLSYGFITPPPLGTALLARLGYGIESDLTPDAWLDALAQLPLLSQPGERFNYGHSIDVLGFVAARALGMDLHAALREKLCAPLGMSDTGFWVPPEKRARLAPFYTSTQPGQFTLGRVGAFIADQPMAFASAGQGLVSTASDYLRFARMLLNQGELDGVRVLKADSVRLMRSNQFTDAERQLPFVAGMPFTQGFGLGMSVVIDPKVPGLITGGVGTFGWPGAFGGWWQADPTADLVLIWLQGCAPAPPQPGAAMPRVPGQQATRQFRQVVYEMLRA